MVGNIWSPDLVVTWRKYFGEMTPEIPDVSMTLLLDLSNSIESSVHDRDLIMSKNYERNQISTLQKERYIEINV
jgi:hypothetical protein